MSNTSTDANFLSSDAACAVVAADNDQFVDSYELVDESDLGGVEADGAGCETVEEDTCDQLSLKLVATVAFNTLTSYIAAYVLSYMLLSSIVGSLIAICSRDFNTAMPLGGGITCAILMSLYGLSAGRDPLELKRNLRIAIFLGLICLSTAFSYLLFGSSSWFGLLTPVFLMFGCLIGFCWPRQKKSVVKKKKSLEWQVLEGVGGYVLGIAFVIGLKFLSIGCLQFAQGCVYNEQSAPTTSFQTVDGQSLQFSEFEGKVIVVEYWATWCGPCIASMPHLREIHQRYEHRDDFVMISVTDWSDRRGAIKCFQEENELPWELVFRPAENGKGDFAPAFIPAAYIIDRDGRVVASHIRPSAIDGHLEELFAE